ncbi:MAG: sigma-54-dependent Fis family transcriptional regulator [Desulfobaccales bacterium]
MAKDISAKPGRNCPKIVWDPATRYKVLLEVNNAIVNQTSREDLFRSMAREIRKIFRYDRFSINIYEPDSNSLSWFAMAEGITVKGMDDVSRSLDKGPVARAVLTSRRPLIIPDMSQYSHWESIRLMMEMGLRATMAFPLMVRGNIVGSLHFSFKDPPEMIEELAGFLVELSGQVALAVDNMLSHTKLVSLNTNLEQQKRFLLKQVDPQYNPDNFYYSAAAMQEIMRQVEIIADSDASVLITGETGTGKDCIARYLHYLSARREALFVKVNCPALSETLFESELFGHVKGAFTGAHSKRVGRFEMANSGTIFLDEIGELPMPLQAKLLHVLQDRRFERVGDSRSIDVNFRVIAASNNDLQAAIRVKNFRSDLFYRLNTVSLHVPPLRERAEEIEPLILKFTQVQAESMRRVPPAYSSEVMDILQCHSWPGNVRELKNIVTRLIIVFSGKTVVRGDIEPLLNLQQNETPIDQRTLDEVERAHLIKVLNLTKGVVGGKKGAAAFLKMPKSTLQYKLRTHGLNPQDFS